MCDMAYKEKLKRLIIFEFFGSFTNFQYHSHFQIICFLDIKKKLAVGESLPQIGLAVKVLIVLIWGLAQLMKIWIRN